MSEMTVSSICLKKKSFAPKTGRGGWIDDISLVTSWQMLNLSNGHKGICYTILSNFVFVLISIINILNLI